MQFSTKSVGFWETPSIHIDLRKTSNFSSKLPCFRIFIKFSKQQLAKMCIKDIKVGCVEISPSSSVKNLGVWFDSSLSMSKHITKLCASAFFYIYNIRHIRKYLSRESAETWVNAFIFSRLDYGNSPLFDLPHYQITAHSKKTLGDHSFSCAAPKLGNILPFGIRCSNSIVSFKSQLKTFLFKKVFYWYSFICMYIYLFIYCIY